MRFHELLILVFLSILVVIGTTIFFAIVFIPYKLYRKIKSKYHWWFAGCDEGSLSQIFSWVLFLILMPFLILDYIIGLPGGYGRLVMGQIDEVRKIVNDYFSKHKI